MQTVSLLPGEQARRRACILDPRLVLSRHASLAVARLGHAFDVWMANSLCEVLRDPRPFVEDAGVLLPRPYGAGSRRLHLETEASAAREELLLWDDRQARAWPGQAPLHHFGDRLDESTVPPALAPSRFDAFQSYQQQLDDLATASRYDLPRGRLVVDAACETAALCAALTPERGFILSRLEADGRGSPALCDYLQAWEVPVQQVPAHGGNLARPVREAIVAADVGPLVWSGAQLAVACVLPRHRGGAPGSGRLAPVEQVVRSAPAAFEVFWFRL